MMMVSLLQFHGSSDGFSTVSMLFFSTVQFFSRCGPAPTSFLETVSRCAAELPWHQRRSRCAVVVVVVVIQTVCLLFFATTLGCVFFVARTVGCGCCNFC